GPEASARPVRGGLAHPPPPGVGLRGRGALPGAGGRARARTPRIHAPRLGGRGPVPAAVAPLARLDARHLRSRHRGPVHAANETRGFLVQRARARRGPLELRLPPARFVLATPLRDAGPARQPAGLLRISR